MMRLTLANLSLMSIRKNNGPRTVPSGTWDVSETVRFLTRHCYLMSSVEKKFSVHFNNLPLILQCCSLRHNINERPCQMLLINIVKQNPFVEHNLIFWQDHGRILDPGGSWKSPIKQGLSVLPSFHPSFYPSVLLSVWPFPLNFSCSFFYILAWCQKLICSCAWRSQILWEKNFCHQNWGNGPKMGQKQGFLNLLKNLVINFY